MAAYRCGICAVNWPCMTKYNLCPHCHNHTRRVADEEPLTESAAQSTLKGLKFDAYYRERGEQPLPPEMQAEVDRAVAGAEEQQKLELWLLNIVDV